MNTSNKFTFSRMILSPVFFLLYFIPIWTKNEKLAAISVFIYIPLLAFMELTDFFDGYFARKNNEVTDFGKLFDPFADVMVHLATFLCFMFSFDSEIRYMYPIIFMLILYREMSQNFLRMVAASKGTAIAARKGGKIKTVGYVISSFYTLFLESLVRLNFVPSFFGVMKIIGLVLFILCLIASYASFIDYLIHFGKLLKQK